MIRTKVINDSADLVSIIRAFDSPIKKEVFIEILKDWIPTSMILEKFGDEGRDALEFFDKMKLAETKWTTPNEGIEGNPKKCIDRSIHCSTSISPARLTKSAKSSTSHLLTTNNLKNLNQKYANSSETMARLVTRYQKTLKSQIQHSKH
jgi:hypothetical protein